MHEYRNLTKQQGQFKPKFAVEVKLKLVTRERNCWVSAFSLLLVVVIHRFRHLAKRDLGKIDLGKGKTTDLPGKRKE